MSNITLPQIFQKGMVLQRRIPICVWGQASGHKKITVQLGDGEASAEVKDGKWQVYLPPMQAATSLVMYITADNETLEIQDIAIGEVWLAGGQSNMEFLLRFDEDKETAQKIINSDIRCFEVPKLSYDRQEEYNDYSEVGIWRKQGGEESLYFTAVGFYFANKLHETLGVPIGIINCTWGGTSASVFTSREYLTGNLCFFVDEADKWQKKMNYDEGIAEYRELQKQLSSLPMDFGVTNEEPIKPSKGMMSFFEKFNSYKYAPFSPFCPSVLHRTMLKSVSPFTISGVIWYQGESDEAYPHLYEELMSAMIRCWRDMWTNELPFIIVQLASFEYMMEPLDFVPMRKVQEDITKNIPKVNLICAMDAGLQYDIHPKKKKPIGERLALQALSKVYGYDILSDSPSVSSYSKSEGCIDIEFAHCGSGLYVKGDKAETIDLFIDERKNENVKVSVSGNHMIIESADIEIDKTAIVKFAWHPYCVDNVYNSADLPMLPFKVEL
ncbi:MAG: sialate O-acetylesterase [Eubacteriales bacterium]